MCYKIHHTRLLKFIMIIILCLTIQGSEFTGARKADLHERQRLIQLVHLQAQEIEALKEEIILLSRKGGHILPPAQPPMPGSAQASRSIVNT